MTGFRGTLFILVFISGYAHAEVSLESSGFSTSDEFRFNSTVLRYDQFRSDLWWPFAYESEEGGGLFIVGRKQELSGPVYNFELNSLDIGYIRKYSKKLSVRAAVGFNKYKLENVSTPVLVEKDGSTTSASILLERIFLSQTFLRLSLEKQLLFSEVLYSGDDLSDIDAVTARPLLIHEIEKGMRLTFRGTYSALTDHNQRQLSDAQLMYQPWAAYWLWVGAGTTYTSFDEAKFAYYSPSYVRSAGPRFEFGHTIFDLWSVALGGSYNWTVEEGQSSRGHYLSGRIGYGRREDLNIFVNFEEIASKRSGRSWDSSGVNFGIESRF